MNDDLFQSVPQGSIGAQDAENRRIEAIADELRRRCELYEAQRGDSQSHVTPFEAEQRVAELFAKENGLWIPMDQVFDLGTPGPSGNENDTYVSNDVIFKVNNLLNNGSIPCSTKLGCTMRFSLILFINSMLSQASMAVASCPYYGKTL